MKKNQLLNFIFITITIFVISSCSYIPSFYVINFDSNEGDSVSRVIQNEESYLYDLPIPEKENYLFAGWYDNSELTGEAISAPYYVTKDTTLYAKWISEPANLNLLSFTIKEDNTYSVSPLLNSDTTTLEIPAYYRGLPVTSIPNSAFEQYTSLTTLILPNTLEIIGDSAFYYSPLQSLTFGDDSNLKIIGTDAFIMANLSSLTFGSKLTTIGAQAFYLSELTSLTFENNTQLTTISDNVFASNKITELNLPTSVTTIGANAFNGIMDTNFTIPLSVTSIGSYAFSSPIDSDDDGDEKTTRTVNCMSTEAAATLNWSTTWLGSNHDDTTINWEWTE